MLKRLLPLFLLFTLLGTIFIPLSTFAANGITLYTPYTGLSVTPGESIDYSFDILNHSNQVQQVSFQVDNLPKEWKYDITSGGWNINQLSIKPNDSRNFSINVEVPLEVQKGDYQFFVIARSTSGVVDRLPITVRVTEKGTFKTELTTEQSNMEGNANASFNYELSLKNRTAEKQHYALKTDAPRGWDVNFQVDGKSVTSITAESNVSKDINVEVTPPEKIEAGTYQIPITATTDSTSAKLILEAVITGNYDIELSTPSGRLSDDITAGKEKTIELEVRNTGSVPLRDITLKASQPIDWEVEFEPAKLNILNPGKSEMIKAKLTASDKAIAGDYVVTMDASTPEATSSADFRMTVETSLFWGWVGVLIIVLVLGSIYYFMRKYGRR